MLRRTSATDPDTPHGWGNPLTWPAKYARWLHLQFPGGEVEKLPIADAEGRSNVKGLSIVGDLTGVPLLKLSANAGHDVVCRIADELEGETPREDVLDLAIVGGGTAGFSAAKEAHRRGLRYCVFEGTTPFNTIKDFPKGKPIYTYPTNVEVSGDLAFHEKSAVKEGLVEDLEEQTVGVGLTWVKGQVEQVERRVGLLEVVLVGPAEAPDSVNLNGTSFVTSGNRVKAKRVIVAIGRSGNYRELGVPGENLDHKVTHRLYDPADHAGQKVLVVGGGDSAIEAAAALAEAGADVTLSYRRREFNRPKPENQEHLHALAARPDHGDHNIEASDCHESTSTPGDVDHIEGRLTLLMPSVVKAIRDEAVELEVDGETRTLPNDQVFLMIGREAPLDFFRRSGVRIRHERTAWWWTTLIAFLAFCVWMYHWQKGKAWFAIESLGVPAWPDPSAMWTWLTGRLPASVASYLGDVNTLGGTIIDSASSRSFYYTLAYSLIVVIFGVTRVRRRRTPYVFWQTLTLAVIQVVPLFLLPEIILPYLGRNGWFDDGALGWIADQLFPAVNYGAGREYWRAYGLVLAWPLLVWNWFTHEPIWGWVVLGVLQTFVLIPAMVFWWGKGAYCGWICSCGALAETLGDRHREKMPHGPFWNKVNFIGQAFLFIAIALQLLYVLRWIGIGWAATWTDYLAMGMPVLNWNWFVDLFWAGILGVGLYFWFSGRVWCRFACPLAALMHVYHRFGRFAIIPDKKKCISCNVCTSVCHQGIDIMSYANKGKPMIDPQCVRCSACVQMCPTGVLEFGRIDRDGKPSDRDPGWLAASPVLIREGAIGTADRVREKQAEGVFGGTTQTRSATPVTVSKPVGLTINGRRARKSSDPSPLSALLTRVGVRS